jgi:hypothetical protein
MVLSGEIFIVYGDGDTQFWSLAMEKASVASALVMNIKTGFQ